MFSFLPFKHAIHSVSYEYHLLMKINILHIDKSQSKMKNDICSCTINKILDYLFSHKIKKSK